MKFRKYHFFSPTRTLVMMCLLLLNSNVLIASASSPATTTGELDPTVAAVTEEGVYEIDYRGPETHSAVFPPPAGQFQQGSSRPSLIHRHGTAGVAPPRSQLSSAAAVSHRIDTDSTLP